MTMRMLSVSLLLCTVMVLTTAVPTAGVHTVAKRCVKCLHEWNGDCYMFEPVRMTWANAEKTCLSLGGHLASILNKTEHVFIQAMIRSTTGAMTQAWIGGYDVEGKNAAWMWSDGHTMTFTDWARGEPNNNGGHQQNCMVMNFSRGYLWDDEQCYDKFASVCKIPAEDPQ